MSDSFELHPRLAADCTVLGDLPLSRVLLMNDNRFPWCILVPRRHGLRELHELEGEERTLFFTEMETVSRALISVCSAHKLNVGALGNMVPQLHIHVVARQPDDAAWPGPVWGSGAAIPYGDGELTARAEALRAAVGLPAA